MLKWCLLYGERKSVCVSECEKTAACWFYKYLFSQNNTKRRKPAFSTPNHRIRLKTRSNIWKLIFGIRCDFESRINTIQSCYSYKSGYSRMIFWHFSTKNQRRFFSILMVLVCCDVQKNVENQTNRKRIQLFIRCKYWNFPTVILIISHCCWWIYYWKWNSVNMHGNWIHGVCLGSTLAWPFLEQCLMLMSAPLKRGSYVRKSADCKSLELLVFLWFYARKGGAFSPVFINISKQNVAGLMCISCVWFVPLLLVLWILLS